MNMKKTFFIKIIFICLTASVFAQHDNGSNDLIWSKQKGLEYRLKAGFNIGGTAPLPLPREIRKINSYNPLLQISLGAELVKQIDTHYGVLIGISLENKGMLTDAKVKNYKMKIIAETGGGMSGRWTGNVVTEIHNSYLTVPILAVIKLSPQYEIKSGVFFSHQIQGRFTGYAYNGYLRDTDPTGSKLIFDGDTKAFYDFSKEMRSWQCGLELGGQWQALKHLCLYADLSWGLVPIFKNDFETITFNMYPIYLNLGFAYNF